MIYNNNYYLYSLQKEALQKHSELKHTKLIKCLNLRKNSQCLVYVCKRIGLNSIAIFGSALNPGGLLLDLKLSRSVRLQIFKHASIIERVIIL